MKTNQAKDEKQTDSRVEGEYDDLKCEHGLEVCGVCKMDYNYLKKILASCNTVDRNGEGQESNTRDRCGVCWKEAERKCPNCRVAYCKYHAPDMLVIWSLTLAELSECYRL